MPSAAESLLTVTDIDKAFPGVRALCAVDFELRAGEVRGQFQPSTWGAFWLTYVEGIDSGEVAEQLAMSVEAVYMARSRSRAGYGMALAAGYGVGDIVDTLNVSAVHADLVVGDQC